MVRPAGRYRTALGGAWPGARALGARSNDRHWERDRGRVGPRWSGRVH